MALIARLPARNIRSVIRVARQTRAPSPMPGNTYMLLHCEAARVRPSISRVGKGLPVATRPRPWVAVQTSSGVHSQQLVGLESGITTGCGQ